MVLAFSTMLSVDRIWLGRIFLILSLISCCVLQTVDTDIDNDESMDIKSQRYHSLKCTKLKDLSDHIMTRLKETANKSYEGGNPDWINQNLPSYEVSEVRFLEVFDGSCDKIPNPTNCHDLYQQYEKDMYQWFLEHQNSTKSIYDELFVDKLELCCKKGYYGPTCDPCKHIIDDKICGGKGDCDGDGTRMGDGTCQCQSGYYGETCQECNEHYYKESHGECHSCHIACKNGCTSFSESACIDNECSEGYEPLDTSGCKKIDYCANKTAINCTENEFCVSLNTKFECRKCDKSCNGCVGDSNHDCLKCAEEYTVRNRSCDKLYSKKSKYRYMRYEDEDKKQDSIDDEMSIKENDDDDQKSTKKSKKYKKKDSKSSKKSKKSKKHEKSKNKKKAKQPAPSLFEHKPEKDHDDDGAFDEL